jgi:TIR domain-containing protein
MYDRLQSVIQESVSLGARSILFSLQEGGRTARIHLEPERDFISELRVFVSYSQPDLEWARHVRSLLRKTGFQVSFIEPPQSADRISDAGIAEWLTTMIEEADYLCLIFSERSVPRDWVRFEFNLAASRIGRVVLVKDRSVSAITDFGMRTSMYDAWNREQRNAVIVRHTIVDFVPEDPEMQLKLARQIINEPEEGVTDGSYRPLVLGERNLKRECRLKRFARAYVQRCPEFAGTYVMDVLPFFWSDIEVEIGHYDAAFDWFVEKHGRLNMKYQVRNYGTLESTPVRIPVTVSERKLWPESSIPAFVLWKREWNEEYERNRNNVLWWS